MLFAIITSSQMVKPETDGVGMPIFAMLEISGLIWQVLLSTNEAISWSHNDVCMSTAAIPMRERPTKQGDWEV